MRRLQEELLQRYGGSDGGSEREPRAVDDSVYYHGGGAATADAGVNASESRHGVTASAARGAAVVGALDGSGSGGGVTAASLALVLSHPVKASMPTMGAAATASRATRGWPQSYGGVASSGSSQPAQRQRARAAAANGTTSSPPIPLALMSQRLIGSQGGPGRRATGGGSVGHASGRAAVVRGRPSQSPTQHHVQAERRNAGDAAPLSLRVEGQAPRSASRRR
jgi:hypothetical protein